MKTVTAALNALLPETATVATLLVLGAFVTRVARLLVGLWVDAMPLPSLLAQDGKTVTKLQRFARLGLVAAAVNFVYAVLMSLARLASAAVRALCTVAYALLPLVMLAMVLVLMQSRWADAMSALTTAFNGPIGSTLRWALLAPLTLLDLLGRYVLPAWNLGVLLFVHMPVRFVGWLLSGSGAIQLVYALRALSYAPPAFMHSASLFVAANARLDCPATLLCDTSNCTQLAPAIAAQACLDPRGRELDCVPAARFVQQAAVHVVASLGGSCGALALLFNVTLYPLTDAALWYAGDRALNAVLAAAVVAPSSAAVRCALAGGIHARPAMCTPDFAPAFALAAEAALQLGSALTHWLDALYLWLRALLLPSSQPAVATWPWQQAAWAFGHNATVLVRMSAAASALTDGVGVLWIASGWTLVADAWPIPVDPRFGIASVRVSAAMYGLMGCACSDAPFALQCAVITPASDNGSSTTAWVLPAEFSLDAETQRLTCARVRINVESLRWPQARIAVQTLAASTQASAGQLVAADAAIYVTPVCGAQDGALALACLSENVYTHGVCFPYCLGLRFANGFRPLLVRGAAEWTNGVVLASTDCSPAASSSSSSSTPSSTTTMTTTQTVCRVASDVILGGGGEGGSLQGDADTCSYAATCVSALADKAAHAGYTTATALPSASAAGGARLLLDGQPLVVGGGVQLRAFAASNASRHYLFDLPTLVGNQLSEFTVEPAYPRGVPASPTTPPTPSDQAPTARLPTIDMPPQYVQATAIPYNPGTLARDALWYASNPSYAAIDALLRYCASEGRDVALAVMFLSSYAPMRLQRVLTAQDSCYVDAYLNQQICADDLFTAQAFPNSLPVLTDSQASATDALYALCVSPQPFNLYAEGLEYWDDANIAVAVRQGTVAELARLLHGNNASQQGRTRYFFAQSADVGQIRADTPWPTSPLGTPASSFDAIVHGVTNASVGGVPVADLPDLGGFVGHSLAAVLRAAGVVVNAFLNPFAFSELLDARWAGTCPDDALQHSALANCGMALLDLDPVFVDIYAASHAFWDAVAWFTRLIFPSSMPSVDLLGRPLTAATLRNFLMGLEVVGDASQVETLFGAARWVSVFDTGAEKYLEQGAEMGRRRLLSAEEEKGKKSMLSHVTGGLKKGFNGFASLTKTMMSVLASPPFTGADFSALFAPQAASVHMVGASVSAPPVAFAEFTYKAVLPMVLDIVASLRAGQPSVASVWLHLGTVRDLFSDIVDQRLRQACAGVRLSMGYDTQVASSMYWTCRATADVAPAMLQLLSTLFADMTLYRCLCVSPSGTDYLAYVQAQCPSYIPATRKAFWQVRRLLYLCARACVGHAVRVDVRRHAPRRERGLGPRLLPVDGVRVRAGRGPSAALGAVGGRGRRREPRRAHAVDRARAPVGLRARVGGPDREGVVARGGHLRGGGRVHAGGRAHGAHAPRTRRARRGPQPPVRPGRRVADDGLTGHPRRRGLRRQRRRAGDVPDVPRRHPRPGARRLRHVVRQHRQRGRGVWKRPQRALRAAKRRQLRALAREPGRHRAHAPAQRALSGVRVHDRMQPAVRVGHRRLQRRAAAHAPPGRPALLDAADRREPPLQRLRARRQQRRAHRRRLHDRAGGRRHGRLPRALRGRGRVHGPRAERRRAAAARLLLHPGPLPHRRHRLPHHARLVVPRRQRPHAGQ